MEQIMLLFSIVIPLYNKSNYVVRALNSVLNQTLSDYEVIIVNDGSTDNSYKIVEEWIGQVPEKNQHKFKLITQQNSGVSAARNNGVKLAKYKYIAFLDADDYWEKSHLECFAQSITRCADKVDIFTNAIKQLQGGDIVYPQLGIYDHHNGIVDFFEVSLISSGFINSSSVCVKKDALESHPFPIKMKNMEDVCTWARIASTNGIAFCSNRTAIQTIDTAEASLSIDFSNYLQFENTILNISDRQVIYRYLNTILFYNIMFARLNMTFNEYFTQTATIFAKSFRITLLTLIGCCVPKSLIHLFRNKRKN